MSELIDIYDENMVHIGVKSRDRAHMDGNWHRTIHCWIFRIDNDQTYVLFQKRGADKKLFPNALDITAAGHYCAGEKQIDGTREILEELGISVDFTELIPLGIKHDVSKVGKVINREFSDVYLLNRNEAPWEYAPNENEVEGLVQVELSNGLSLFSGSVSTVKARGIEWDKEMKKWNCIDINVSLTDIIPRVDSYYYKIFIMVERFINGQTHLSV